MDSILNQLPLLKSKHKNYFPPTYIINIKPFPINWIDTNIKNSYGIILDDLLAGIYTIIILILINGFI